MSDDHFLPDLPESNEELASLLKKLQPNPLEYGLKKDLEEECDEVFSSKSGHAFSDPSPRWSRLIPLVAMGALGMLCYTSFHYSSLLDSPLNAPPVADSSHQKKAPVVVSSLEKGQFQPVSAQGFLINSSSEGVIETDEGPQERVSLKFRDAYHWHNSETGTSIRFFQPRDEEVIVPLPTD